MKFNTILVILAGLISPFLAIGGDSNMQSLFEKGNTFYAKADYKNAISAYQQILDKGYQSAAVYFNLGNADYRNGDVPLALLYYEKAHKLSPGDEDINFNIRFANLKTTDKIDEAPEFFLNKWWQAFILAISANALAIIAIALVLAGSAALILYFFTNSVMVKKISFYVSIILFFLSLTTLFIANRQVSYFDNHRQAIIFSGSVTVKGGPLEKASTLFILHEGTKVNMLDRINGWVKIKLANNSQGWIRLSDVKEI